MATFNSDQAGMAFFLLVCVLFNIWFVYGSAQRVLRQQSNNNIDQQQKKNVNYSVLFMALFDIPWVWLCAIQCLYNTFTYPDPFHQSYGEDSFGCKFMGWYSSFSMVGMMGSNCLVGYSLWKYLQQQQQQRSNVNSKVAESSPTTFPTSSSTKGLFASAFLVLLAACLFASMPLMQGDGYLLTTGGFCYADFTNSFQSAWILSFCLSFLLLSTYIWIQVGLKEYWCFYAIFFCTWILWVPACIYGIVNGTEIAYPYMLIGAIIGHANALVNPLLYGKHLFVKLARQEVSTTAKKEEYTTIPEVKTIPDVENAVKT